VGKPKRRAKRIRRPECGDGTSVPAQFSIALGRSIHLRRRRPAVDDCLSRGGRGPAPRDTDASRCAAGRRVRRHRALGDGRRRVRRSLSPASDDDGGKRHARFGARVAAVRVTGRAASFAFNALAHFITAFALARITYREPQTRRRRATTRALRRELLDGAKG
jgi:hypothetical protein